MTSLSRSASAAGNPVLLDGQYKNTLVSLPHEHNCPGCGCPVTVWPLLEGGRLTCDRQTMPTDMADVRVSFGENHAERVSPIAGAGHHPSGRYYRLHTCDATGGPDE